MNKLNLLVSATLASLALSATAAFATEQQVMTPKQSKPVPVKIVHPTDLPRDFENYTVELKLTIDENGVPHDVRPAQWMPRNLSSRIVPVVAQWRFSPSYVDGHPVKTEVVLPLKLVEGGA